MPRSLAATAALAVVLAAGPAAAGAAEPERERLDIELFARVPSPGQPEPVAVGPDGLIYVGTNQQLHGDARAPSEVLAYRRDGTLRRRHVLAGQELAEPHGIQGLAFDGRGRLYVLDRSARARVVRLDTTSGAQQHYATFADVPPCEASGRTAQCSATTMDQAAEPDYAAFGPDGSLYVTDIEQALIWRVPPRGGEAQVWYTHADFENVFGPNGVQVVDGGRALLYTVTARSPRTGDPTSGALYRQPILAGGLPGPVEVVWRGGPGEAPDGLAVARSGNVYLALAGANQVLLLSPDGRELARAPSDPLRNALLEVPVDSPGSLAFLGERLLVTNHSAIRGDSRSWALLDVWAGEPGLPLFHPFAREQRRKRDAKAPPGSFRGR